MNILKKSEDISVIVKGHYDSPLINNLINYESKLGERPTEVLQVMPLHNEVALVEYRYTDNE